MLVNTTLLLRSLHMQQSNPFVSKHVEWNAVPQIGTADTKLSLSELRDVTRKICLQERKFLRSVARQCSSADAFLHHQLVNPQPSMTPRVSFHQASPVSITVACLPVKSENSLKTTLTRPDLGEVALLVHFEEIAKSAHAVFGLDLHFKLLVEATKFGEIFGIRSDITTKFTEDLKTLSKMIVKNRRVMLVDWGRELRKLKTFRRSKSAQRLIIEKQLEVGDKATVSELLSIFPTVYMSLKSRHGDHVFLHPKENDKWTIAHVQKSFVVTVSLMAFNQARSACNERRTLFPKDLPGTLTPGPGKWGFFAIGPWNMLYPHHGVGIFDHQKNRVFVTYESRIQMARDETNQERRYLRGVLSDVVKSEKEML